MPPELASRALKFFLVACAFACASAPALGQSTQPQPQLPDQSAQQQDPADLEPLPPAPADQAATQGPPDTVEPPKENGFFRIFVDEEDGKVDFSNFLAKGGFIPVPIIITEPVVEGGFGLAAAFLTVPKDNPNRVTRRFVAAFKTGNGSTGGGYFESGYAFDGQLNYRVGIGRGNIKLEAFPAFAPQGVKYTNDYKYGVLASALWSLGGNWSAGPVLDYRRLSSGLEIEGLPEDFTRDFNNTLQTGALGFGLHFDSRDNQLTPTRGLNAYVEGKFNRGAFGSDRDYEDYDAHFYGFTLFAPTLRGSLKLELDGIRGDYPAYFAPAITLRGVQAIRYQGQNVLSSEAELAWQLSKRWSLLAFGGVGATNAGSRRIFKHSGLIAAGGAGVRYRLARKLGMDAGLDFAYGPGGFVFYVQFGHAWMLRMD